MSRFRYRKPEQAPLLGEDTRKTWSRPAPPKIAASDKVGPVAPVSPRPKPVWGQRDVRATHDQAQWARMWELKRRVAAGEDLETVKRELWADQYKGQQE